MKVLVIGANRDTGLDYMIVCPGGLTDEAATERVVASADLQGRGFTSRENLALAMVMCLYPDNTIGKSFGPLDGDVPIVAVSATKESIARLPTKRNFGAHRTAD